MAMMDQVLTRASLASLLVIAGMASQCWLGLDTHNGRSAMVSHWHLQVAGPQRLAFTQLLNTGNSSQTVSFGSPSIMVLSRFWSPWLWERCWIVLSQLKRWRGLSEMLSSWLRVLDSSWTGKQAIDWMFQQTSGFCSFCHELLTIPRQDWENTRKGSKWDRGPGCRGCPHFTDRRRSGASHPRSILLTTWSKQQIREGSGVETIRLSRPSSSRCWR